MNADQLPTTRKSILETLKRDGKAAIADLAGRLGMSGEAVRQQLLQLQREGWVEAVRDEAHEKRSGRPAAHYRLTPAGDHLFPKNYDTLGIALLDAVSSHLGPDILSRVLSAMTEARAKVWEQRLAGKNLHEKLQALTALYDAQGAYAHVEDGQNGLRLVEQNCPYLNVANQRPVICSISVALLSQLLGVEVVREERFQDGDGRCVFRVYEDRPLQEDQRGWKPEPAKSSPS
ncbi:MAG: helix-turn-helix transcriptional regulator [Myxococcales bacterium]